MTNKEEIFTQIQVREQRASGSHMYSWTGFIRVSSARAGGRGENLHHAVHVRSFSAVSDESQMGLLLMRVMGVQALFSSTSDLDMTQLNVSSGEMVRWVREMPEISDKEVTHRKQLETHSNQ